MKNLKSFIIGHFFSRCPKSGKITGLNRSMLARVLFPLTGILAILWFLIRVIPKPSRITYPCQQAALGIGSGFVAYLIALTGSVVFFRKLTEKRRGRLLVIYLTLATFMVLTGIGLARDNKEDVIINVTPPEGRNNPMGVAKGLFPGRVAWTRDAQAASWNGEHGHWWDDNGTDQEEVNRMLSVSLQNLTGTHSDRKAWKRLFTYTNDQRGEGNRGYGKGEKIVIKVNMNANGSVDTEWKAQGFPSPQMLYALIRQRTTVAGVEGKDIIITDPSRYIGRPIIDKLRSDPGRNFQDLTFEEKSDRHRQGFRAAEPDTSAQIWFNMPDGSKFRMCFPKSFSEASYIINYSLVRPHRVFGITSVAKNHFGSVWNFGDRNFRPNVLHAFALWDYPTPNKMKDPHSAPVLLGHRITREKTLLYLADGLYTSYNQGKPVVRMSSFGNHWFSSLLMSQDPVALESVVYDFISNEPNLTTGNPSFNGNQDNQFQECALANDPPSGTFYDPENDGTGLQSLGVHEHWNNSTERKYSRNLGLDKGIELIQEQIQ